MDTQRISGFEKGLNIDKIFKSLDRPSLPQELLTKHTLTSTMGLLFAVDRKATTEAQTDVGFSIKVSKSNVMSEPPIRVIGVTGEVMDDVRNAFNESAEDIIARLLNGIARDYENDKFIEWLDNEATVSDDLVVDQTNTTELWRQVFKKVQDLVLESNVKRRTTFNAFCILPYNIVSSIMGDPLAVGTFQTDNRDSHTYLVAKSLTTEYYLNPNPNSQYGYVGIKSTHDDSTDDTDCEGCGSFCVYQNAINEGVDPTSGQKNYFIYDRFAIATNPLHSAETPMMFKFKIS